MSISRRALYEAGLPFGESCTRREGGRVVYGDGGGSQQTGQQTQVVDLPDWVKPYAKETLGKAQALTDQPYQPYTGGERIAGFDPLQQQAQAATGTMTTAPQLQAATGIAGAAGLGSLAAGDIYRQQATTPGAMQAYMSPYMQNVVDIQQREAQRQADIARTGRGAQAVRAGAFGGSRQAIMEAEAGRNLQQQMGDIQARGLQSAFDRAQQAQQFGAELGLRGYGQAGQLAQTLGGLGATQFGQQKDIISMQAAAGKERQALEQQRLSQQYEDFLRQQQFPYQQLGFFSDMLRGVPVGQTATTIYNQPQESLLPSLIGAGGAFMSSKYGPFAAEGGEIKYAAGQSVVNPLRSLGEMYDSPGMSADQLKAIIASPQQSDEAKAAAMRMLGQMQRADSEAQAAATQQVLMDDMARGPARGLDAAAAMSPEIDAMYSDDPAMMSRGGLTSFQSGTEVDAEAAQRQADREALLSGIRKPAAAAYDILTLPVRGVAGAFESAVTRPLRALGVDVPYLPESFYGGDRTSMTPMYDKIRREEEAQAAGPTVTPQDPTTTPTADDYMVTGEGSARVATEDAAAAPAELVAPQLKGISELGQGSATAMSNLRDLIAQQDEEAKVNESEKRRRWMFNLFANIAKTKTTRKGFDAVVESIANGFASMPAYEAEQEKIERQQRRLQQEREINLARIDVAIAQNKDQMAMQAQQYQNTLDLQYKQLEALRESNIAKLQSAYAKIAQDSKRLGVDMFTALNRAAADRAEAAREIESDPNTRALRKKFVEDFGEQSGAQKYRQWLNDELSAQGFVDTSMLSKFLGGTTTTSQQKPMSVSEALAKAPAKQ